MKSCLFGDDVIQLRFLGDGHRQEQYQKGEERALVEIQEIPNHYYGIGKK